jgi:hypothetical protein
MTTPRSARFKSSTTSSSTGDASPFGRRTIAGRVDPAVVTLLGLRVRVADHRELSRAEADHRVEAEVAVATTVAVDVRSTAEGAAEMALSSRRCLDQLKIVRSGPASTTRPNVAVSESAESADGMTTTTKTGEVVGPCGVHLITRPSRS